jgi:hypothetical protein
MAPGQRQHHRSYLLRIWRAGNGDAPEWRLSLEDAQTHERHGFTDLESLAAFLDQQMHGAVGPHVIADTSEAGQ